MTSIHDLPRESDYIAMKGDARDQSVLLIPKSGTNSIKSAMRSWVVARHDIRVGFIRNPLDRFWSAYSFLKSISDYKKAINGDLQIALENYESFVDYALVNEDHHWLPQSRWAYDLTHAYRLEEIDLHWTKHWPGFLPGRENRSQRQRVSTYRLEDLIAYYKEDFELWLSL